MSGVKRVGKTTGKIAFSVLVGVGLIGFVYVQITRSNYHLLIDMK